DLDGGAGLLELPLDRVGLLAVDALLDRVRGTVDQVLRLLQAEARVRADDLERGLLLARRRAVAAARRRSAGGRDRDRSGGGDAPLLLDLVLQLDELENRHLPEVLEDRVDR